MAMASADWLGKGPRVPVWLGRWGRGLLKGRRCGQGEGHRTRWSQPV